jgi:UDP-N-acetylmuramoyl-L-alanyl-D-glutamate--2,6-diaminopimelate ligase
MKLLKEILYKTHIEQVSGSTSVNISDIAFDSRKVSEWTLFVAVRGTLADGHDFISKAIDNGAIAIICEEMPENLIPTITYVRVKDSSHALAIVCNNFYEDPSTKLKLIGVTGTNGKTTSVTLLHSLFTQLGFKCGMLSTVKNLIGSEVVTATHTTPDPLQLNQLLARMVKEDCEYCFMEVSSHAVVQKRIEGLHFQGGVFTNITRDHLDYHKTFDEYIKAKKGFFDRLPEGAFALINADDKNSQIMVQNTKATVRTFAQKNVADFKVKILENNFSGLLLNIDGNDVLCSLIGSFNASNLLGAYAVAIMCKQEKIDVLTALSSLKAPEGRFECLQSENNITGIVDYAHTPDALENVLHTINNIRTGNETIITIIGCGGDRDAGKRPQMAAIACELSDKVILTSDNPRSENPDAIIKDMQAGVPPQYYRKSLAIADRKEAIRTAVALAQPGDIILLAGKGHEKYQEINGVKYPFDDKEILSETFQSY